MANPLINQALLDLENGLRDIQSATNDVRTVAEKSNQLINTISKLVELVQEWNERVSHSRTAIDRDLEYMSTKLRSETDLLLENMNQSIVSLDKAIEKQNNSFQKNLKQTLAKTDQDFENSIVEFTTASMNSVSIINHEISNMSNTIAIANKKFEQITTSIDNLNEKINGFDLKEEFNTIRSRSNKNFFILLAVNVALFAAIAALIMIR
jgi:DNA anti-recombination protein RmuC